jgi:hypothetical protein
VKWRRWSESNLRVGLRRDRSSLGYEQYDRRLYRPARSLASVLTSTDGSRLSTSILGASPVSACSAASRAQTRAQILAANLRFSGRPKCATAYASPGWSSRHRRPTPPGSGAWSARLALGRRRRDGQASTSATRQP